MSIFEDIRTEITSDASLAAIVSTRVFLRKPHESQTLSYITFVRNLKERGLVEQKERFQMVAFSKDMDELETMSDLLISLFEGRVELNNQIYTMVSLISQSDASEKMPNGFFWNILTFQFQTVT